MPIRKSGAYALCGGYAGFTPADAETDFFGICLRGVTTGGLVKVYIPRTAQIRVAEVFWNGATVVGSNENISIYVRVNDTTDYLIATVGDANQLKRFNNTALNIPVVQGDYIEIKCVFPTWATNPTGILLSWLLLLQV